MPQDRRFFLRDFKKGQIMSDDQFLKLPGAMITYTYQGVATVPRAVRYSFVNKNTLDTSLDTSTDRYYQISITYSGTGKPITKYGLVQ